jgi:peroxiredoxin
MKLLRAPAGLVTLAVFALACAGAPPRAAEEEPEPHEYAPIRRLELASLAPEARELLVEHLESFSGETRTGEMVRLEELRAETPVVLLTIFAEWCDNCGYEAPELVDLHRRFGDRGFAIVARSEYSHPAEVTAFVERHGIRYPVILGSANPDRQDEDAVRTITLHYRVRRALGDEDRKWGTPFNVLLVRDDPGVAYVVMGEFEPGALEAFLESRLEERG